MEQEFLIPDPQNYDQQRAILERKRKIAAALIATEPDQGVRAGNMFAMSGPLSGVGAALSRAAGQIDVDRLDAQDKLLGANESRDRQRIVGELGKTGKVSQRYDPEANPGTGPLINGEVPMTKEEEKARRFGLYAEGMNVPSLRKTLESQMGAELKQPLQEELLDAKFANAQTIADAKNEAFLKGVEKRIEGQKELRAMPTIHITNGGSKSGVKAPSGYRYNEDGTALEAIPGGPADPNNAKGSAAKPLTQKQLDTQRGYMDLDTSIANYEKLLGEYDFRGGAAVSPAKRAALEGAYTDLQMKLKDLYSLGAPQAGDLKLLSQAIPNPVDLQGTLRGAAFGADPFKAKLNETKKLLTTSQRNFEKQMGRATPEAARSPDAPTVVRTGTRNGVKVQQMSDGSIREVK